MSKKFLLVLFFILSVFAFASGNRERQPEQTVTVVRVTGIVRLVGSDIFPEIVISGEHNWYIARNEMRKLHDFQHRTVTVEGEETITELTFAGGMPAGRRRDLKNIRIISVE
ncbi:MAG: hypothetical protein FWC01_08475 [Treponema sp.]|nr:hypothetical protein [Treponema sp.]MCL2237963.1 hypothetical protein [Treponema sp.]